MPHWSTLLGMTIGAMLDIPSIGGAFAGAYLFKSRWYWRLVAGVVCGELLYVAFWQLTLQERLRYGDSRTLEFWHMATAGLAALIWSVIAALVIWLRRRKT